MHMHGSNQCLYMTFCTIYDEEIVQFTDFDSFIKMNEFECFSRILNMHEKRAKRAIFYVTRICHDILNRHKKNQ